MFSFTSDGTQGKAADTGDEIVVPEKTAAFLVRQRAAEIIEVFPMEATITCPECGATKRETMPENACQYFYTCASCGATLRPLQGDCCVFCSYSDQLCPPKQAAQPAR